MLLRSCFLGLAGSALLATGSAACPWAGGKYRVQYSPDYEMRVNVNAKCTSVWMTETYGNVTAEMQMVPQGKKWLATHSDGTRLVFDARGRNIRASRGGANLSARAKRLN